MTARQVIFNFVFSHHLSDFTVLGIEIGPYVPQKVAYIAHASTTSVTPPAPVELLTAPPPSIEEIFSQEDDVGCHFLHFCFPVAVASLLTNLFS